MNLMKTLRKKLTSEEINELPLVHYGGPVSIIRSKMLLDLALPALKEEPVLGFDTESRPTFRKGVAHYPPSSSLLRSKCVYIIQLKHLPLNREITDLLSSPNQIKAGVGIGEDMRELANLLSFTPQGHVDLANIAEKNRHQQPRAPLACSQSLRRTHLQGAPVFQLEPSQPERSSGHIRCHRRMDGQAHLFAHA